MIDALLTFDASLTLLERQILQAVAAGGTRCHPKYLPEVLALMVKGKLKLVASYPDRLEIARP